MTQSLTLALGALAISLIALPAIATMPTKLVWNASASVPIGLYVVRPIDRLSVSDLVVAMPPEALARFLTERRYLGRGVPLIKHVAATPGQTVCRIGETITIDGDVITLARQNDRLGRPLPIWRGCQTLDAEAVFLLNPDVPDSMDGRYFGPLPRESIVGRAVPLWTMAGP